MQAVAEALAGAKRAAKAAIEAHEATADHLAAMGGWMVDGHRHALALARAGFPGASDHPFRGDDETGEPEGVGGDDPDVELAARAARRKSKLDALDARRSAVSPRGVRRKFANSVAPFWLRTSPRRAALIDRIYGAK